MPLRAACFAVWICCATLASAFGQEPPAKAEPPKDEPSKADVTKAEPAKAAPRHAPNRLAKEKSPYLLQHKFNPVDWHPWGEEAFAKAKRENKPIFLSIGYSTCHWCHVMERESFEDEVVAKLLNQAFVCVKVDREERPDVDNLYMEVCQIMTQRGGWPLTILMTPDKKPFFAATYLPKKTRPGMLGMVDLVPRVEELWKNNREDLNKQADGVSDIVKRFATVPPGDALNQDSLTLCLEQFTSRFDPEDGGFVPSPDRRAPKFPTPHNLMFLLRAHLRTKDAQTNASPALNMVETTLRKMRAGGLFDQVGYGFHRYSTDPEWLAPHFEKMLYDQALLTLAYAEAHQLTRKPEYRRTAEEILTYVLRDMTSPDGAFYSAEDADSEGEEGKFYLWTVAELSDHFSAEDAALIAEVYGFTAEGNFIDPVTNRRHGGNIPHWKEPPAEVAERRKIPLDEFEKRLDGLRRKMHQVRELRVHPQKDDKVLTDWNGLMIAALARSSQVFDEPRYADAARRAADFVLSRLRTADGRLLHRYRDGDAALQGNVDDYAMMIWGLLELYEATFEVRWLETAVALNRDLIKHFRDEAGGLYFTAADAETLLVRQKEVYDGASPSGNSVSMLNWLRLARLTGDVELEAQAQRLGAAFSTVVKQSPSSHAFLMLGVDFQTGPSHEIVLVGPTEGFATRQFLTHLRGRFQPNKVILFKSTTSEADSASLSLLSPFTRTMTSQGGKPTAYVCRNFSCELPTSDPSKMLELLQSLPAPSVLPAP